jgi:Alpha/beta hydrolase domain
MKNMWRLLLVWSGCCLVASFSAAQEPGAVPLPTVTGPIPVTATSHPMNAATFELKPEDLSVYDYVEEEYLLSGKANVYDEDADGKISVKASDAPYTTRILVRRPRDPKKFSGSVVAGPMNPSTNVDLLDPWMKARRYITDHGDVYVGMTGVEFP